MGTGFDASQLLKGSLDLAVLAVLADVREASVYGTLNRLFRAGLLVTRVEPSANGPHRKYYALSSAGAAYLADGRLAWTTTTTAIDHLLGSATGE